MRPAEGLYDPKHEHDACGVGFVANIGGEKSHSIVVQGIEVLKNLLHRGATGADPNTGDGAGLLLQIPDRFLRDRLSVRQTKLPSPGQYGVGMLFMPRDEALRQRCQAMIEEVAQAGDLECIAWRDVPTDPEVLGETAKAQAPYVMQCFLDGGELNEDELERRLYIIRKQAQARVGSLGLGNEMFYVPSLSCRTIVYKGLMMATQIPGFYPDLNDERLESAVAVVHQRYSTNTFPSWELAQPFRYLAHNGEINTLRGNLNWMRSRQGNIKSDLFGADIEKILPIIEEGGSDSACLDNALELLINGGRSIQHSMSMLMPQAWGEKYPMGPDLRGFYEYHAGIMEPWDGPAAVAFTDGRYVGALLDRNGLRPARYTVTEEGFIVFASEVGVLDIPPERVKEKGALRPGQMILVDMDRKHFLNDYEIKMRLARRRPYRRWCEENSVAIHGFFNAASPIAPDTQTLPRRQAFFGYTREDLRRIIDPMASSAHEPVGSMGSDEPLAVLSEKPQLLYWYFKQMFAQVTNPPIDPIREELVMSLMTFLGCTDQILTELPSHARLLKLQHPILSNSDLNRIRSLRLPDFQVATLNLEFPAAADGSVLGDALKALCRDTAQAVRQGARVIVLSDKDLPKGRTAVPALLGVAAVNQYLVEKGLRTSTAIVLETGEAREVMHMAVLLGYGASAINPYLAYETIADMALRNDLTANVDVAKAMQNYTTALCKGLLKIMSKMGISTLRSYRNAQVFQAIGLGQGVTDAYFPGTSSQVGGIGLDEIAWAATERHRMAWRSESDTSAVLPSGGHYQLLADGERHLWTSESVTFLQWAARNNDTEMYRRYAACINDQSEQQSTLRGLFKFKQTDSIPLEQVEPAAEIVKRFVTGAMSFGSISREAHETLAIAMNRLGGMSNSGEGGEDRARFEPLPNGDSRCSAIKQIASGRFGVTTEYLVSGRDLQIKIAQGAKPGEGGQLPGHKVNEEIARVRHSTPGVSLISPPPHHDIYSIEDIAQLIYDLHCANPDARVSVKLVSEIGVGTVAAGLAKGKADMILISGYDGGTGASPLTSLKHAGAPWELGLAETQQTLVLNGLRSRVRLQADGQIKTGRDVVVAALLGAEEFGFATSALVVCGCIMMRKCHKNTCPVGVATQDPKLRKRFSGKPEYVVNFLHMLAEEVRELMAQLGFRGVDEMVGRSDLLEVNDAITFWKAKGLDFSKVFHRPEAAADEYRCTTRQEHGTEDSLDHEVLSHIGQAIEKGKKARVELPIRNIHRTVGTLTASRVAKLHGADGLPDDTLTLEFSGAAGQSFGAFACRGMTMVLKGEANDYVGKGLSGGRIVLKPFDAACYDPSTNIIAGNVLFYGATSGEGFVCGCVGERFAIRNSGARLVVEGVGDHGCEYMTGGRAVILGPTGVNFGAGMSGGIAYVYDETGNFDNQCNLEMLDLELVDDEESESELRDMLEKHVAYTGSAKAQRILDDWEFSLPRFIKVFPMEYKRVLGRMLREDADAERREVVNN